MVLMVIKKKKTIIIWTTLISIYHHMFHFEFDNRRHIPRSCQWHCMFDNYSRYTQLQGRATGRAGDNHAQQSHDVTIVSFFFGDVKIWTSHK